MPSTRITRETAKGTAGRVPDVGTQPAYSARVCAAPTSFQTLSRGIHPFIGTYSS